MNKKIIGLGVTFLISCGFSVNAYSTMLEIDWSGQLVSGDEEYSQDITFKARLNDTKDEILWRGAYGCGVPVLSIWDTANLEIKANFTFGDYLSNIEGFKKNDQVFGSLYLYQSYDKIYDKWSLGVIITYHGVGTNGLRGDIVSAEHWGDYGPDNYQYVHSSEIENELNQFDQLYIRDNQFAIREVDTNGVPEPATILLLGTGLVGLIGSRVRRKKKK